MCNKNVYNNTMFTVVLNSESGLLQYIPANLADNLKPSVEFYSNLPLKRNNNMDCRVVNSTQHLYVWHNGKWNDQGMVNTVPTQVEIAINDLKVAILNIYLTAFRLAQHASLSIMKMVDGIVDEFINQSGIDLIKSSGQTFDSPNNFYANQAGADENIQLLLKFDGDYVDSSIFEKEITPIGGFSLSNDSKFGTSALDLSGNGYLSVADSSDFAFGTGDFTIDCWIKLNYLNPQQVIVGQHNDVGNSFYIYIHPSGKLAWYDWYNEYIGNITLSTSVWQHIAIVRASGVVYLFVDGVLDISFSDSRNLTSEKLTIGNANFNYSAPFGGLMDEFTISKGIARWTSTFTPPTSEHNIAPSNIILVSKENIADIVPVEIRSIIMVEALEPITLNVDLKLFISRDGGVTFTECILSDEETYDGSNKLLTSLQSVITQPSGQNIVWKIESYNLKLVRIHAVGLAWK